MTELTVEQALDFSIKKWEAIVENNGQGISKEQNIELDIWNFRSTCGLCQKYYMPSLTTIQFKGCISCPFNQGYDNGCSNREHPWYQWYMNTTKENAQIVLDALKKLKI